MTYPYGKRSARCEYDGNGCDGYDVDGTECACPCHDGPEFLTPEDVAAWHCDCDIAAVPGGTMECGQHGPGAAERRAWAHSD